jgi:phage-related protein
MKKLQARFFVSSAGGLPVRDWILDLVPDDRRIVGKDIQKVEFGWPIGMPYCRPLGSGLWETRSDLTDGKIARVIFTVAGSEMILLPGFVKKTQKTPRQDIALAIDVNGRWNDDRSEKSQLE